MPERIGKLASKLPRAGQVYEYDFDPYITLSPLQAQQFREAIIRLKDLNDDSAKGCLPVFGVRVRFTAEEGIADVDLCFDCDILRMHQDGQYPWGEHIDTVRPELVQFCKEVFPNDPEIQALRPGG